MPGTVTVARNSHVNKVDTALLQKSITGQNLGG